MVVLFLIISFLNFENVFNVIGQNLQNSFWGRARSGESSPQVFRHAQSHQITHHHPSSTKKALMRCILFHYTFLCVPNADATFEGLYSTILEGEIYISGFDFFAVRLVQSDKYSSHCSHLPFPVSPQILESNCINSRDILSYETWHHARKKRLNQQYNTVMKISFLHS